jgi:sialidase-1
MIMKKVSRFLKRVSIVAVGVLMGNSGYASAMTQSAPVFEMQELFEKTRILNITVATDGTVLAFTNDGRLLRRSEDAGKTWSPILEIAPDSGGTAIVDQKSGDVLVLRSGNGLLWRSQDHGKTWKKEEIVVKPNALGHGVPHVVGASTHGSESGISLQYGEHKGRLIAPARVTAPHGSNDQEWWPYHYNMAVYSDDGGRTWQASGPVQSGTGEGTLAELSNGTIYYNSRSHLAVDHRRQIAWSYDGGHMWTDWSASDELFEVGEPSYFKYGTKPSYGCSAGLVSLPLEVTGGKDVLIYSSPDNPGKNRFRMTVWASFDGGETWPLKRLVYEGHSAYSSLAADKKGNIFLLFEWGVDKNYEAVYVAKFNLDWLANGKNWRGLL